jgi:hypothetical protein
MASERPPANREPLLIGLILVFAALHGLVYVFLMPPWQHYDEPNHFEYVWFAGHLERLPSLVDYSPKLSRQVLKSMLEHGFYDQMGGKPVIGPPSEKVKIPGYSQLSEPPLYYILASLPARLFPSAGIVAQLYASRLVSLSFLLATVLTGYGVANELAPRGHPLRWLLPITLALTPAFVDLMSAVNDDAAAIAISSALLWTCVLLVRRGFSISGFALVLALAVCAYLAKITALVTLIAVPPALLFSLLRGRLRVLAWGILVPAVLAAPVICLRYDDARAWYRSTSQESAVRVRSDRAVAGAYVLAVESGIAVTPRWNPEVFQHIPASTAGALAGKEVTFGYWIWSDQAQRVRSPAVRTGGKIFAEELSVDLEPTFYAFQVTLPPDTGRIWIDLSPKSLPNGSRVYYDGLILVEGRYPITTAPHLSTSDGAQGEWGGTPFVNLLRNGSAETVGPRLVSWFDDLGARFLPDNARPSLILASLVDFAGGKDLYPVTAAHLFQTFWARFGWGHVPLLHQSFSYRILLGFSLIGLAGAVFGALLNWRRLPWDVVITLGLVVIPALLMAWTRGAAYLGVPNYYYSTARYIYPVIVPLMLLLNCGWLEIFHLADFAWLRGARKIAVSLKDDLMLRNDLALTALLSLYLVFFILMDLLSVISIGSYYGKT